MNVLEKLGVLYALTDCGHRDCNNCIARFLCGQVDPTERLKTINEISTEVRTIIKERYESIAKLKEITNDQEK